MAFFKCRVGDQTYELPKLTLGEARILKRNFGMDDLEDFSPTDPDHLTGLLYLCVRREKPSALHSDILADVEAIDIDEFDVAPESDPTQAAGNGSSKTGKSGAPATRRKPSGTRA